MLRFLAIPMIAACGFELAPGSMTTPVDADPDALGTEPGMPDDAVDAPMLVDAPPALSCHGSFEIVCLATAPATTFDVNGGSTRTIDTDTDAECRSPAAGSSISSACIVAAAMININGTLRATGSKPLILIGTTSVTVNGGSLIDVSSRGTQRGAGGRVCPILASAGGNAGGAGASFGTRGGMGGAGGTGTAASVPAISPLTDLVGGCNGAPGGAAAVVNAGIGGTGGGAVLLIGAAVVVNGTINASGGGAGGGLLAVAGGGGGGSGGAIVIDTMNFTFAGGSFLYAQGGGGGEGASLTTAGSPGGNPPTPGAPALGGKNTNGQGGDGGNGAVSSDASNGGSGNDGGGGGGGGAGHIRTTDTSFNSDGQSYPAFGS